VTAKHFRSGLAAAAAVALAVRLLAIAHLLPDDPMGDNFYFHGQANLLADGHWFVHPFTWEVDHRLEASAIHPPLYVLYLAVGSLAGLRSFAAHAVLSSFLGVGTVVVAALCARRLAGNVAGLVAAGLVAVHPGLWLHDAIVMSESLYALTVACVVLAALRAWDEPSMRRLVVLGVAVAAAALTRGEALLLFPLLVLPLVRRSGWRAVAVAAAAFAGILAPWVIWNSARFSTPVLISLNSNEVVALANCPNTYYGIELGYWTPACYRGNPSGDEAERAAFWRRRGLEYIREHSGRVPFVVLARLGGAFGVYHTVRHVGFGDGEGRPWGWGLVGQLTFLVLLVPAMVGAGLLVRRKDPWWPTVAPAAAVFVTAALVYGSIRFRLAAEVVEVLLVSVALAAVPTLRRRSLREAGDRG